MQRGVTPQEALWYETTFEVPAAWRRGNDVLLHFGAVDWRAEVYVNDLLVGSHTGGYTPFSFDITPALSAKGVQKLTVKVTDSTDKGFQPHGKQVLEPHGRRCGSNRFLRLTISQGSRRAATSAPASFRST